MTAVGTQAMAVFRGRSRDAVVQLRERLTSQADTVPDIAAVGVELFAVTALLDAQPALRRSLTDAARSGADRAELVKGLLRGKVGETAVEVTAAAVALTWSRVRDLADGLEYAAVWALVIAAERTGKLADLEDELFRFGRIVEGDAGLLRALTDRSVGVEPRIELARSLLAGRVADLTVRLVEHAVANPRGRTLDEALAGYVSVAAERKQQLIAVVYAAVPLSAEQRDQLSATLARQYDRAVDLKVIVDPSVVGGLRIQIGDELIDASLAGRLDRARRKLAG